MKDLAKQFEPYEDGNAFEIADRGLAEFEQQLQRITPSSESVKATELLAASKMQTSLAPATRSGRAWFVTVAGSWCGGALAGAIVMFAVMRTGINAQEQSANSSNSTSEAVASAEVKSPENVEADKEIRKSPFAIVEAYSGKDFSWDPFSAGDQLMVLTSRRAQRSCCYSPTGLESMTEVDRETAFESDATAADLPPAQPSTRQTLMNELLN